MFRTARRPFGNLALLLLLAPSIAGCVTTQRTPFPNEDVRLDRITGVTMRSGREIKFSQPGASISNDTMYALGRGGQMLLPVDSVSRVSLRKVATGRSLALLTGLAGVGILALMISSWDFKINLKPVVASRH
jgi:hypothetical protein